MSIHLVKEFSDKFDLPTMPVPMFPPADLMHFRIKRQEEEGDELWAAYAERDLVKAFDALLDAAYIIYGTALTLGITPEQWTQGFAAVHAANMRKVRAERAEQSKYGMTCDIVKPAGWIGPEKELTQILEGTD